MPEPLNVTKAIIQEISWDKYGKPKNGKRQITVQFNPETLKVSFSNQIAGGDQAGGSAIQYSGKGTTKLSFDLWFDVTSPNIDESFDGITDVRRITAQISQFLDPKQKGTGKKAKFYPPGVRFTWGSFLFEGVMDSFNETLEFFSEEGVPLRANASVSLTKQDVEVKFNDIDTSDTAGGTPGTQKTDTARQGEPYQQTAARSGDVNSWIDRALDNNLENPRFPPPGQRLF